MNDSVSVRFEAISEIAQRLLAASTDLGDAGSSLPAAPGGGLGARQAARTMSHLLEQLAHLCLALEFASEALEATSQTYETVDSNAARRSAGLQAAM